MSSIPSSSWETQLKNYSSSSPPDMNPEIIRKVERIVGGMVKLPGCRVVEYVKLMRLNAFDIHPVVIVEPFSPRLLLNLALDGTQFVFLKTNELSLERVSNSELKQMGFHLAFVAAIDSNWTSYDDFKHKARNSVLDIPPLSVKWNEADGSIAVSSAKGVNWTVVGGEDIMRSNFERFKELPPEFAYHMSHQDIMHAMPGVSWTENDATQLLSVLSEGSNWPLARTSKTSEGSESSPANSTRYSFNVTHMRGSDDTKENKPDKLSSALHKVLEIFRTAGKNIDSQIGAAIITLFGVATQPIDNGKHITPIGWLKLVCHAFSCLFIFVSWMLKPTSGGTPVKEERLKALSELTAGVAIIFTVSGVFSNIFAALHPAYAICAMAACVWVVLGGAAYNAFSK